MDANSTQVGGDHYQAEYQVWDFILDCRLGYLEGNIVKYIARHRKKNGVEDLKKALHYLDKLIECTTFREVKPPRSRFSWWGQLFNSDYVRRLVTASSSRLGAANDLLEREMDAIEGVCLWSYAHPDGLLQARWWLRSIIIIAAQTKPSGGTLDGLANAYSPLLDQQRANDYTGQANNLTLSSAGLANASPDWWARQTIQANQANSSTDYWGSDAATQAPPKTD